MSNCTAGLHLAMLSFDRTLVGAVRGRHDGTGRPAVGGRGEGDLADHGHRAAVVPAQVDQRPARIAIGESRDRDVAGQGEARLDQGSSTSTVVV